MGKGKKIIGFCSQCSAPIYEGDAYCDQCGKSTAVYIGQQDSATDDYFAVKRREIETHKKSKVKEIQDRKSNKKIKAVFTFFVVLIIIIVAILELNYFYGIFDSVPILGDLLSYI